MQQTVEYQVSLTEIYLQDLQIDLDSITEERHDALYKVEKMSTRSYENDENVVMTITVEMNTA